MLKRFHTKHDFILSDDEDMSCDFCDAYGQQESAEYMTNFAVEGVATFLFRYPRPVYLCDDCYDNLPKK